jgi:hypothetical protein
MGRNRALLMGIFAKMEDQGCENSSQKHERYRNKKNRFHFSGGKIVGDLLEKQTGAGLGPAPVADLFAPLTRRVGFGSSYGATTPPSN